MFQRAIRYIDRHFPIQTMAARMTDRRRRPHHKLDTILRCVMAMFLSRAGSVHALHQTADSTLWRKWLKSDLPGENTVRRAMAAMTSEQLRQMIHEVYAIAKRKKMLPPLAGNWQPVIFDATETSSSELRCCAGCCVRHKRKRKRNRRRPGADSGRPMAPTATTAAVGDHPEAVTVEYYHREVLALLPYRGGELLLDFEPILPREGEQTAALRLFKRLMKSYPRAFNVALSDALYTTATWFNTVKRAGIEVQGVLKQKKRDLPRDFIAGCALQPPREFRDEGVDYRLWDLAGFHTWPQMVYPVRLVRSIERWVVTRQGTGEQKKLPPEQRRETIEREWIWATTLPVVLAKTMVVVGLGHQRWLIENEGFNELKNRWHLGHVYAHQPAAILNFLLVAILVCNPFHLFVQRNLDRAWRKKTMQYILELVRARFFIGDWRDADLMLKLSAART